MKTLTNLGRASEETKQTFLNGIEFDSYKANCEGVNLPLFVSGVERPDPSCELILG